MHLGRTAMTTCRALISSILPGRTTGICEGRPQRFPAISSFLNKKFLHNAGLKFFLFCPILLLAFAVSPAWPRGDLGTVTVKPSDNTAGYATIYTITFTATGGLPQFGKIVLTFPAGFDLTDVDVAHSDSINGGLLFSKADRVVTVTRDGKGDPVTAGSFVNLKIGPVGNHRKVGSYDLDVSTLDNTEGPIDSDTSTPFTIAPGAPSGIIALKATPAALPINSTTPSVISTTIPITDADINTVGSDRVFNVTVNNSAFGYIASDASPSIPGIQVKTDLNSHLSFNFIAGDTAGLATIFVSSLSGTAAGSVNISVNELRILKIETAPEKVTRDHSNIPVDMLVQNVGTDTVTVTADTLIFTHIQSGVNDKASYEITYPPIPSKIPGNSVKTLTFLVKVKGGARLGLIRIDGKIIGTLPGGTTIMDIGAESTDSWTAQKLPDIRYLKSLSDSVVSVGTYYEFSLKVKNGIGSDGQATFELNPDSTTFQLGGDANPLFVAKLNANYGTKLPGDRAETILRFRREQIPQTMPLGFYTPKVTLIGTQNGVRFAKVLSKSDNTLLDSIFVQQAPPLQIEKIISSQNTVTQGMTKDWTITLHMVNNTGVTTALDNTEISLVKPGSGPDASYDITKPATFKSGSKLLAPSGKDSLTFTIETTGQQAGTMLVFAKVYMHDASDTNKIFVAESSGTQRSILVQTPALLKVALRTSQPTVTQNQTEDWKVTMTVTNSGESDAEIILTNDKTRIDLIGKTGYFIERPSGTYVVAGNDSLLLEYIVSTTGPALGLIPIHGEVFAREINSNIERSDNTFDGDSTSITVQIPAEVSIGSTFLTQVFNFDQGSNSYLVSKDQQFQFSVKVKKTGEEKIDSVWVSLSGTGFEITPRSIALADTNNPATFEVKAGSPNPNTFLTAKIDSIRSANTRVKFKQNISSSIQLKIQTPANLRFDAVEASQDTVRFGQNEPWRISVPITNIGEAGFIVDSSRVVVRIGGEAQNDYTIVDSTTNTGVTLYNGQKHTLNYKVTRTGTQGGNARLFVTVYGRDKNTNEKKSVVSPAPAEVFVETTAQVKIISTSFPASVNRAAGTDIALVDTAQAFNIDVTVQNTGLEVVDNVWVSLTSSTSASQIAETQVKAGPIPTINGTTKATFKVVASTIPDAIGEMFTARIDSAKTAASKAVLTKGPGSTALVRIQLPTRLQLNVSTDDPDKSLTIEQEFTVRALVKNLGQAEADNSGKLKINLPQGYSFDPPTDVDSTKSFSVGDTLKWTVIAPDVVSLDDTISVVMTRRPRDKNSGLVAAVEDTVAEVVVNTFISGLNIVGAYIAAPAGAKDGILSTDQRFTVTAQIDATSNLTNKTATLTLPPGYRFVFGEVATKAVTEDSVRWELRAPIEEHTDAVLLQIDVAANDGQDRLTAQRTIRIERTETQAIVLLQPGISEPAGARNGILSAGQSLTIVATLLNRGTATTTDTAIVTLNLGDTGITLVNANDSLTRKITIEPGAYAGTAQWRAKAPGIPSSQQSALTFRLAKPPLDVNTNTQALVVTPTEQFNVTTVDSGSLSISNLRISAPPGAKDSTLSTGQEFIVELPINWENATNVSAFLDLPAGFTADNRKQNFIGDQGPEVPSWRVRAPDLPIPNAELKAIVRAQDAHNDSLTFADSLSMPVNVVNRAEPELSAFILAPKSALRGVVNLGQPFEVAAVILNHGAAKLVDTTVVRLKLPQDGDYEFLDGQDKKATIDSLKWRIRARQTVSEGTDFLTFDLVRSPFDENTGLQATPRSRTVLLPIRTEGIKLVVSDLPRGSPPPAMRGARGLPLLRLLLTNSGGNNLELKNLRFTLRNRNDGVVAPNAVLKAVRVVNDLQRESIIYGSIDASALTSEVQVTLRDSSLVVSPSKPDTIAIVADLAESPAADHFLVALDNSTDLTVVDQDSGSVVVVEDKEGRSDAEFQINAELNVFFDSDPQASFTNYPNPFRPGSRRNCRTRFTYRLPDATDGELKIFTLLGELVMEKSFTAQEPAGRAGFHDNDLCWDGYNGNGKLVLNGVYIAMLKTKFGTFKTKVAVVK
jgi:hypothetical protein